MSVLSVSLCSLFSAACAFALVSSTGCGTDARGVDDCREIEQARCEAAKSCGIISNVASCQRFYRDQCLHGLSVASPGSAKVKACVATIRAAGLCAAQAAGSDPELSACDPAIEEAPSLSTACDLVREPERAESCAFLASDSDAGSGGKSGVGGATSSDDAGSAGAQEP